MKLYTVVCLIGDLPYIRYGTFKTKKEAVDYVWEEWSKFTDADEIDKKRVRDSLDIYIKDETPENQEWNPWYSVGSKNGFRVSIKPVVIEEG